MVAWKRFPVPEFDYHRYVDLNEPLASPISEKAAGALREKHRGGDLSVCGGYAVSPGTALLERLRLNGNPVHAVMCLLPPGPVHVLGRSWAWKIQNAWILDSLDPASAKVLFDWKTTRPMNTRLGPDNGVTIDGGLCYVLLGNKYADHWLGNRLIVRKVESTAGGRKEFCILSGSDPDLNDFHHAVVSFDWAA